MTYSEIKIRMDTLAADIAAESNRITQGRAYLTMAAGNLAGFVAKYTGLVEAIDALVAAEPASPAALLAADEKARLVAEFVALKATADALVAAISGV